MTIKHWGHYTVLHEHNQNVKVKELVVLPGKCLSLQRHFCRAEHWFVSQGTATVYTLVDGNRQLLGVYEEHQLLSIDLSQWHQLANEHEEILKIIEIQYGTNCIEEDIERIEL